MSKFCREGRGEKLKHEGASVLENAKGACPSLCSVFLIYQDYCADFLQRRSREQLREQLIRSRRAQRRYIISVPLNSLPVQIPPNSK